MRILDLLHNNDQDHRAGRKQELSHLQNLLSFDHEWQYIHLYGPGGIGKSTLLHLYIRSIGESRCLLFDGNAGFRTPREWLSKLHTQLIAIECSVAASRFSSNCHAEWNPEDEKSLAERLNCAAKELGGLVMLFDTFEQWSALADWLRSEWLPLLEPHVRVCSAGRYPLEGGWQRGGWRRLVQNVELHPLSSEDFNAYLASFGIEDPNIRLRLRKFTGGVPLALSIAVEIIRRKSTMAFLDTADQDQTVQYLVKQLLSDLDHPVMQQYLDGASVLWRFNQEWLEIVLEERVPVELFREFCRLPFIIACEEGWELHDSIRHWTRSDLQRRKPQTLELYRYNALQEIHKREKFNSNSDYTFEKLYLHENDLVRYYCFSREINDVEMQLCKQDDLGRMEQLYTLYGEFKGVVSATDPGFMPLIRPLWHAEPESFNGLWKKQRLMAFYSMIPLNERTASILQQYAVTSAYLNQTERTDREYGLYFIGLDPEFEEEATGPLMMHMIRSATKARVLFDLTPYTEWYPVLVSLGLEHIRWADSQTSEGVQYTAFLLDLREEDYGAKLNRLFYDNPVHALAAEEAFGLTKDMLIRYHRLDSEVDLLHRLGPLFEKQYRMMSTRELAGGIRRQVNDILNRMEKGTSQDRLFANLLRSAYIHNIGSHEVVAETLELSMATYYRQLKKAVARLGTVIFGSTG